MLPTILTVYAGDFDILQPDVIVKKTVGEVLVSLRENRAIIRDHGKLDSLVASKVLPRFDYVYMVQLTIGYKQWVGATPQERMNLVDEYRTFIEHIFSNALSQYDNQTVSFAPFQMSPEASDVVVKSKLIDPGDEPDEFDFKLEKTTNGWMIYDIELGGIDLIRTYRSNFRSSLLHGGVPNLISALHKKNQEIKAARNG